MTSGTATIVIVQFTEDVEEFVSVTCKVNAEVPGGPVGVPETTPVEVFSVRPLGRDPAVIANVNGSSPPVTGNVWV